jgi:hypothetical protein
LKKNFEPLKNFISDKKKFINEYQNIISSMEEKKMFI